MFVGSYLTIRLIFARSGTVLAVAASNYLKIQGHQNEKKIPKAIAVCVVPVAMGERIGAFIL
jgi:hypothetical protein